MLNISARDRGHGYSSSARHSRGLKDCKVTSPQAENIVHGATALLQGVLWSYSALQHWVKRTSTERTKWFLVFITCKAVTTTCICIDALSKFQDLSEKQSFPFQEDRLFTQPFKLSAVKLTWVLLVSAYWRRLNLIHQFLKGSVPSTEIVSCGCGFLALWTLVFLGSRGSEQPV